MIKYKIALVNVFWSENENNTRYFINRNEQNIYFDNLASGKTSPLVNYNMGNNIETTIVYKDTTSRRVDEIVKSNYAIVYTVNVENEVENIVNRRYFFAYPRQDSGRQMIVDLVLDDVQTNFLSQQPFFDREVLIKRASLSRFAKNGNMVEFTIGEHGELCQKEDFRECPKYLIQRTPLNIHPDTSSSSQLNTFIDNNIIGWEYVYLTPDLAGGNQYRSLGLTNPYVDLPKNIDLQPIRTLNYENAGTDVYVDDARYTNGNSLAGALICLCAPVYKNNSLFGNSDVMQVSGPVDGQLIDIAITNYGLEQFLEDNGMYSRVFARKFSIRPPLPLKGYNISYSESRNIISLAGFQLNTVGGIIGGDFLTKDNINVLYTAYIRDPNSDLVRRHGCFMLTVDNLEPCETSDYFVPIRRRFSPNEIIGANKNPNFNPKLLGESFLEFNLVNFSQNFTYDFQKLVGNRFKFQYTEALTPDITKGYARIKPEDGNIGLYQPDSAINLTGLVLSNDYSLMIANDKLSEMLANNKNFYLQQALNIGQGAIAGGLAGGMSGGPGGAVLGVASSLMAIPKTIMNIDNMRASPNQVKNANGSVYFATKIQPFKLAVELYQCLESDRIAFNDYCYMFGYNYGFMGLISDFINIRKYFNYIEADLVNVPMNMSNIEKVRLVEKFNRGIRFWNSDNVDFSKENYEIWLEDMIE